VVFSGRLLRFSYLSFYGESAFDGMQKLAIETIEIPIIIREGETHDLTPTAIQPVEHLKPETRRQLVGITLTLLSGLLHTEAALFLKLTPNIHPLNQPLWGGLGFFIPIAIYVFYLRFFKEINVFHTLVVSDSQETEPGSRIRWKWKLPLILVVSLVGKGKRQSRTFFF